MSKNIVFEGWLTKSPPTKRIWRTKWRRRWFALRQSGELPGQYFLDYYADRNRRRLKGTINLDLCEQVDAGLHMERTGNGPLDTKQRGSVFTIQTQSRTYHLEADCEADMEKWVDAICKVCGLRATEDTSHAIGMYQNNFHMSTAINDQCDTTGPYIPISECITGVRAQHDSRRAFTFDPKNIVTSRLTSFDKVSDNRGHHMYTSQPQIRLNNADFSENESTMSDEECKSLNASQSNIREWAVEKSFTKLTVNPKRNGLSEDGPPVPPRPPKTLCQKDIPHQGVRFQETVDAHVKNDSERPTFPSTRSHRRDMVQGGAMAMSNRGHLPLQSASKHTDDEMEPSPEPVTYPSTCGPRCICYEGAVALPTRANMTPAQRHTDDEKEPSPENVAFSSTRSHRRMSQGSGMGMSNRALPPIQSGLRQFDDEKEPAFELVAFPPTRTHRREMSQGGAMSNRAHPPLQSARRHTDDEEEPTPEPVGFPSTCGPRCLCYEGAVTLSTRAQLPLQSARRHTDDEEEPPPEHVSIQYCNMSSLPPAVDRALKPRHSSYSIGHIHHLSGQVLSISPKNAAKTDVLQYLDLDLHMSKPSLTNTQDRKSVRTIDIAHIKSLSAVDADAYKTVDFLKTEAFNITRQDAEASRSNHY